MALTSRQPSTKAFERSANDGVNHGLWHGASLATIFIACGVGALVVISGLVWRTGCQVIRIQSRPTACEPVVHDLSWHLDLDQLNAACARYSASVSYAYRCKREKDTDTIPEFRVLGERHSGTNAIAALMYANFDALDPATINTTHTHEPYKLKWPARDFGITEHKHDEQTVARSGDGDRRAIVGLTVVAIREPYAWVQSMSKEIYGGEDRNKLNVKNDDYNTGIEDFLSTSWEGGDHVYTTYADLFDMRYRKVCNHVWSALNYSQHVLFLRHEDDLSETSKLGILDAVARWTGWPLKRDIDLQRNAYFGHSEGKQGKGRGLGEEHATLMRAVGRHADWGFERILGYVPLP